MTSTNKPKRIALFLILFFTALGITLANATTENTYKNTTNLLPRIYESTHTENDYKANIIINPHTTGIYAKENDFNIDLTINPKGIGGSHSENNYQLDLIPEKTFPYIPDLAVTNVAPSKTVVGQGYTITIEATIKNKGFHFETFRVTAYANTTIIQTKTITLTSFNHTTVTFTWNTTGASKGNYTITTCAWPVPGEADLADNTLTDGWVVVTIPGDIDCDGDVDPFDFTLFRLAYGSRTGEPNYDPGADIDCDGDVDPFDFTLFRLNYGKTDP